MQFGPGFSILCVYKMNTYAINIQLHWELMVLLKVFRPAGREKDVCYFLNDQKVTNGPGHPLLPLWGNSP